MKYFGIDMSLNHSAACYCDGNSYIYNTITREDTLTKKQKNILEELNFFKNYNNISINKINKSKNYTEQEFLKLEDAILLTDTLFNLIPKDVKLLGLEGIAYSSVGSRSIDLAGYQYLLRNKIKKENIIYKIYSPNTIKKTAGKGNYNKNQMLDAYVANITNDSLLENCEVYKFILNNLEKLYISSKVIEPISGIVDSYWIIKTLQLEGS